MEGVENMGLHGTSLFSSIFRKCHESEGRDTERQRGTQGWRGCCKLIMNNAQQFIFKWCVALRKLMHVIWTGAHRKVGLPRNTLCNSNPTWQVCFHSILQVQCLSEILNQSCSLICSVTKVSGVLLLVQYTSVAKSHWWVKYLNYLSIYSTTFWL